MDLHGLHGCVDDHEILNDVPRRPRACSYVGTDESGRTSSTRLPTVDGLFPKASIEDRETRGGKKNKTKGRRFAFARPKSRSRQCHRQAIRKS